MNSHLSLTRYNTDPLLMSSCLCIIVWTYSGWANMTDSQIWWREFSSAVSVTVGKKKSTTADDVRAHPQTPTQAVWDLLALR